MAVVVSFSNNVEKFPKEKYIKGKKGVYQNLTLVINDEVDQFGFNAKIFVAQTSEQRKAKEPKIYVGNGKVVWTDGNVKVAKESEPATEDDLTDLPF